MGMPDWQWNEFQQVGTDYASLAEVEAYDERMASFRDVDAENCEMLAMLNLPSGASVLEVGCGTGRFSRAAAAAGYTVSAADISEIMLDYVREKGKAEGRVIATRHAGFLTMGFAGSAFDAVVSGAALHHLPDAWKLVALQNICRCLKAGGQLILRDVVFSVSETNPPADCFKRFSAFFPKMRKEAARHVASEFSTYDWIMEGLLTRAGFKIISIEKPIESFIVYHCEKQ